MVSLRGNLVLTSSVLAQYCCHPNQLQSESSLVSVTCSNSWRLTAVVRSLGIGHRYPVPQLGLRFRSVLLLWACVALMKLESCDRLNEWSAPSWSMVLFCCTPMLKALSQSQQQLKEVLHEDLHLQPLLP